MPENVVSRREFVKSTAMAAAGVSAGIDMALYLAGELADEETAKAIQLAIEYDPQPPFEAGSPAKAGAATVERALAEFARGLRAAAPRQDVVA